MIVKEQPNNDKLSPLMKKIQYFATKILNDVEGATNIFQNSGISWDAITVPEIWDERMDDYFYEWYFQDYVDLFDSNHSNNESIRVEDDRNVPLIYVSYGIFDSYDLYNYGDSLESLSDLYEYASYMDDFYYVTYEFGYTLEDLANDPYKVFEHFDEEDKLYYAEEVLGEFDLFTNSDRSYTMSKDAQGIVNLYNEVENYFSYNNAKQCLDDYKDGLD